LGLDGYRQNPSHQKVDNLLRLVEDERRLEAAVVPLQSRLHCCCLGHFAVREHCPEVLR
jgi:hypothetical protein